MTSRPAGAAEISGQGGRLSRAPHLVAALAAVLVFAGGLGVASVVAEGVVGRHVVQLAGSRYRQKALGLTVQQAALRRPDVLPVFGSSEIERPSPYHAREVFADEPTGFFVLTVAGPGTPVFETLQNVGALGAALRGRKVAISLSPPMFLMQSGHELDQRYAGNFSPLHALTLMLNAELSAALKQTLARRMLARPDVLARNGVLDAIVRTVADPTPRNRVLYRLFLPLARAQVRFLEAQDRLLVLGHVLLREPAAASAPLAPASVDWDALLRDAEALSRARASTNPFGVDDEWWTAHQDWAAGQERSSDDSAFLADMAASETWLDYEQLLAVLRELDARVLVISMPFDGRLFDYSGVSANARRQYYQRVRELAGRYGARTAVLDAYEMEPYFFYDLWSHLSPKGWVFYDRALDAFYHDAAQ